jgi:hypothetical protein
MHLFFENVSIQMFKHWTGNFFKNINLSDESFILPNNMWKEIGESMHFSRKQIPLDFGRPPRNILKHHNGFKAAEWSSWVTMYSLPFLNKRLPELYVLYINYFIIIMYIIIY